MNEHTVRVEIARPPRTRTDKVVDGLGALVALGLVVSIILGPKP